MAEVRATVQALGSGRIASGRPLAAGNMTTVGTKSDSAGALPPAGRARALRSEAPPFAPDPSERVLYFAVEGTGSLMQRGSPMTGFNMESFFGFIESRGERTCNRWPTMNTTSLASCGFTFHYPGAPFWHANVRLFAHAAQRGRAGLAKVGQAGWKTFAQELLPERELHRWVLGAYTSYLLAVEVPSDGTEVPISLGMHPFAKRADGRVVPWLHPAVFLDIGRPLTTATLLERYRVDGHSTYARPFQRAIVLYNPAAAVDENVPLGGEYVDPWGEDCTPVRRWTLPGQSGMLLVTARQLDGRSASHPMRYRLRRELKERLRSPTGAAGHQTSRRDVD